MKEKHRYHTGQGGDFVVFSDVYWHESARDLVIPQDRANKEMQSERMPRAVIKLIEWTSDDAHEPPADTDRKLTQEVLNNRTLLR